MSTAENYDIDALDNRNTDVPGDVIDPVQATWLRRASQLYSDSTDYYESSIFQEWRANIAHFRSKHAPGSKYTTDVYKHRSKVFRPKPRAAVRTLEATAAAALFTNDDLINVRGADTNSREQAEAARVHKAILQHRLETAIPWFMTVIGAYQDTHVYGVCISRQYWDYRTKTRTDYIPALNEDGTPVVDEDGMMLGEEVVETETLSDKPAVYLVAPENFRFDPASDWRDPVNTSPYLIEIIPMYAGEVLAMMDQGWHEYTLGEVVAQGQEDKRATETVRDEREGRGRQDSTEVNTANEYSVVWVHFNIIRDTSGEDYAFYTLGTGRMLTDPVPLKEFDPVGRQRYAVGFSSIEAHRSHPAGAVELNRPLTEIINDVTNQRMDNVKLVLNKRYAIRRGGDIDLGALMRNVPGGGVLMNDPDKDFKIMETPDVTQSSYVEQDRLAVEADELLGTFSQSSVGNNRALNETVGGMNLMSQGANQVQELGLRVFIETWVEPVLRTLVKLESLYETDETILAIAAGKAELFHAIDDDLMMQDLVVRVNVGMGNTNPTQKLERFMMPLNASANLPDFIQEIDWVEVGKEIFALSGHGDGERFMLSDEKKQARAEAMQGQEQQDPRVVVEEMRMQMAQMREGMTTQREQMKLESKERQVSAQLESEQAIAMLNAELQQILAEMRRVGEKDKQFDALKTRLNETVMKLVTTKELAGMKATAEQLPTPPVEPPGRAPAGMSYQR